MELILTIATMNHEIRDSTAQLGEYSDNSWINYAKTKLPFDNKV